MRRVQQLDAVRREKFYCCKNPFPERQPTGGPSAHYTECELMDADTIFNGKVSVSIRYLYCKIAHSINDAPEDL